MTGDAIGQRVLALRAARWKAAESGLSRDLAVLEVLNAAPLAKEP